VDTDWRFVVSFDAERRERLTRFNTFSKVVDALMSSLTVNGGWICEATNLGPKNCWRPIASMTVSRDAFDAFFNSPGGYRAKFLESAESGQAANGTLLRLLEPSLSSAVLHDVGTDRLASDSIRSAFLANSAKIWPDESELDFVEATDDLAIGKWRIGCESVNAPSGVSLWAPEGTELLAIGAFIDPFGNEVVARRKVLRRFELHDCGFT
jgi:hypothetical protein